jgi:phosphoglycolate phosphatase
MACVATPCRDRPADIAFAADPARKTQVTMAQIAEIKGILFDKDGTLIDFNRTWFPVVNQLARQVAGGDDVAARALVEQGGYDWAEQRFRSGSVVAAGTIEDLVDLWHPELRGDKRARRVADYDRVAVTEGAARSVAIAGLHEALALLAGQGFTLGIATNDSEAGARATAEALGLEGLFASIIGYDSVARAKPHADQLHLFAVRTGLLPAQIAMVGDNTHDLEMAHAAGAGLAVGELSGNSRREDLVALSDVILGSVADLPGYFARQ